MTKLLFAVLMVFISACSHSQNIPAKRLIVQLSHELTSENATQLCVKIKSLIGECTLVSQQDSRWIVTIPQGLSQEQIDTAARDISGLDGVSFAEEDRLMKPLTKPPKTLP